MAGRDARLPEERHDWSAGAWSSKYDTSQPRRPSGGERLCREPAGWPPQRLRKAEQRGGDGRRKDDRQGRLSPPGNRTRYHHNIALGNAQSYCRAADLSYTFNAVNQLTAITDADETQYGASLTCDANGNITQVLETYSTGTPPVINSSLTTDFSYDGLNRLSQHKTTRYVGGGTNKTQYTERNHQYDATGRLAKSDYTQYYQGDTPTVNSLEHTYSGATHIQNYDGSSTYGARWHWAGAI